MPIGNFTGLGNSSEITVMQLPVPHDRWLGMLFQKICTLLYSDILQLFVSDFDTCRINVCVKFGFNFESGPGGCACNKVNNNLMADQRLSSPIQTDMAARLWPFLCFWNSSCSMLDHFGVGIR